MAPEGKRLTTMEQEVGELKARLERLEAVVRRLAGDEPQVALPTPGAPPDQGSLLSWLKAQGLVHDPTPAERRLAAEWATLSAEEKQAHIRCMPSLVLTPPLSQGLIDGPPLIMALDYFDASAVVKYDVTEPGSTWVRQRIDA